MYLSKTTAATARPTKEERQTLTYERSHPRRVRALDAAQGPTAASRRRRAVNGVRRPGFLVETKDTLSD